MPSLWVYDHDILRARREALLLGVLNLALMAIHVYRQNWFFAGTSGFWALCCWLWRRILNCQQATRDQGRRIEAGLHSIRREIETGEI